MRVIDTDAKPGCDSAAAALRAAEHATIHIDVEINFRTTELIDAEHRVEGQRELRSEVLVLHGRVVQALPDADVDVDIDRLNAGVSSTVCEYVDKTGTLTSMGGKGSHRSYKRIVFEPAPFSPSNSSTGSCRIRKPSSYSGSRSLQAQRAGHPGLAYRRVPRRRRRRPLHRAHRARR